MKVIRSIAEMQDWIKKEKTAGNSIGLVPTMGSLHAGHISLVEKAHKKCDKVIISIFVNPIQFGVGEDFEVYPRDLEKDEVMLKKNAVDIIFVPDTKEMYPIGYSSFVELEGQMTAKLCGKSRPGHFRGVTTVVAKLFNICQPDYAYFGQKDAQQLLIIEKMVKELNFSVKIVRVPIKREEDGLAMSSRNIYLSEEERNQAIVLNKALSMAKDMIINGERDVKKVRTEIFQILAEYELAQAEYLEICRANDLADLIEIQGEVLIAMAVRFGQTRLIDNLILEV